MKSCKRDRERNADTDPTPHTSPSIPSSATLRTLLFCCAEDCKGTADTTESWRIEEKEWKNETRVRQFSHSGNRRRRRLGSTVQSSNSSSGHHYHENGRLIDWPPEKKNEEGKNWKIERSSEGASIVIGREDNGESGSSSHWHRLLMLLLFQLPFFPSLIHWPPNVEWQNGRC